MRKVTAALVVLSLASGCARLQSALAPAGPQAHRIATVSRDQRAATDIKLPLPRLVVRGSSGPVPQPAS